MHFGRIIFSQWVDFLPTHEFNRCIQRYRGNQRVRRFSCRDQFLAMAFAQLYAFDSTTIDLCLSLFPWANFRRRKGAVKLHTLIDLRGNIPCFIRVTHGKVHDVKALDHLPIEPGAYYVMDRGYVDFMRLHRFERTKAFFVIRAKKHMDFTVTASRQVDKATGLRCDQTIRLGGVKSAKDYPDRLRRIRYTDPITAKRLVLLTHCFNLDAWTITQLYKARGQVELFFKWIKQNLRIKAFYGTSPHAVKTQVGIAVCVYGLVAIIAKQQSIARNPSEILQILGIMLFEKVPMNQALTTEYENVLKPHNYNQLALFDF
jgi:IS4 transposase